jgi:hypothetical protein
VVACQLLGHSPSVACGRTGRRDDGESAVNSRSSTRSTPAKHEPSPSALWSLVCWPGGVADSLCDTLSHGNKARCDTRFKRKNTAIWTNHDVHHDRDRFASGRAASHR